MSRALDRDPWVRAGVSIGAVLLYLLVTHLLAGVVYRSLSAELTDSARIASAVVWALTGSVAVGGFAWLITWRTPDGRPTLHWWVAPIVGVVALVEMVLVVVAVVVPHGESGASWGADVLQQVASPRFWAVSLWLPVTVWICIVATVRTRWFRPRRMVFVGVVPYLLVGVVFAALLYGGVYSGERV